MTRDPWPGKPRSAPGHEAACPLLPAPRSQFWKPDAGSPDIPPQIHELRHFLRGLDALEPLIAHTLCRELRQSLRVRLGGLERAGMDPELEARAESQCAQDPQIVFLKAPVGIADRADQLLAEVLLALKRVAPLVRDRVVGDGVDRKVPARQVVHERHAELNHGVASIGLNVLAKRRDFVRLIGGIEHRHRAMLDPHWHGALEHFLDFRGRRRRGEVEIVVLEAQQVVANRPADAPRLEARVLQLPGDLQDLGGDGQLRWERHPQSTDPPFTFRISPVMFRANREHRNTIGPAISSALPARPSGIVARSAGLALSVAADISVSTHPGATQFTVIWGANSRARDFVT